LPVVQITSGVPSRTHCSACSLKYVRNSAVASSACTPMRPTWVQRTRSDFGAHARARQGPGRPARRPPSRLRPTRRPDDRRSACGPDAVAVGVHPRADGAGDQAAPIAAMSPTCYASCLLPMGGQRLSAPWPVLESQGPQTACRPLIRDPVPTILSAAADAPTAERTNTELSKIALQVEFSMWINGFEPPCPSTAGRTCVSARDMAPGVR
jgi:hypothetical protein